MPIQTILFDLDETLYSPNAGIWQAIKTNIELYMVDRLGIPVDKVDELRQRYYEDYGTSLRGLEKDYAVSAADYLGFIHDVPISDFIKTDERLIQILRDIQIRKVIFTNADIPHANRVLDALGVAEQFSMIIDVMQFSPFSKPFPEAFKKAMDLIGDHEPANYLLVDDAVMNVRTAISLGMKAILVNPRIQDHDSYVRISSIYEIQNILSGILAG